MAEDFVDTARDEGTRVATTLPYPTLPTKVRDPEIPIPCPSSMIVARPGVADQRVCVPARQRPVSRLSIIDHLRDYSHTSRIVGL
jgi:hypothetical protein